jgi:hypothetical protein
MGSQAQPGNQFDSLGTSSTSSIDSQLSTIDCLVLLLAGIWWRILLGILRQLVNHL